MYLEFYKKHLNNIKVSNGQIYSKCPLPTHPDKNPSFSVNIKTGRFKCHGCGWKGNVFIFAKQMGIPYRNVPGYDPNYRGVNKFMGKNLQSKPISTYNYDDQDGTQLYQVLRYEPKDFRVRRFENGRLVNNINNVKRVPYRLPQIMNARTVIICEGEKDADNLVNCGIEATTCFGGAGKWKPEYNQYFKDKDVIIIPDNDEPGHKHAKDIKYQLLVVVKSVRVIALPKTLGLHGDISDFIKMHGLEKVNELISADIPELYCRSLEMETTDINEFPITDAGNAETISKLYGDKIRYIHGMGTWLIWNHHYWQTDRTGQINRIIIECIRIRQEQAKQIKDENSRQQKLSKLIKSEDTHKVNAISKLLKSQNNVASTPDQYDKNPYLLGCKNGVVNLGKGELVNGSPEDNITKSNHIVFNDKALCPRWVQFLTEVFEQDQETIEFMQRFIGYCLSGETKKQVLLFLYGQGENGKGILFKVLKKLLGDYWGTTPFDTFVKSKTKSGQTNDIAVLKGTRVVTSSEINEQGELDEAKIKLLTGEDSIAARKLYQDFTNFDPNFKLLFAINHLPKISDTTHAFWRRIIVVPFNRIFTDKDRDEMLSQKLEAELPGILNWALAGYQKFAKDGWILSSKINNATTSYRKQQDPFSVYLEQRTIQDPEMTIEASVLYEDYKYWCSENEASPISFKSLSQRITQIGITKGKVPRADSRRTIYKGIGLLNF